MCQNVGQADSCRLYTALGLYV